MDYPAKREVVIRHAKSNGAPQEMLDDLESHNEDRFQNPGEV